MSPGSYTFWTSIHGHLGWLVVALWIHPLVLRGEARRHRRARATQWAALATTTCAALGFWLYPHYRVAPKAALLRSGVDVALWFERKEHLGLIAVVVGLLCAALARSPAERSDLRWWWLVLALVLATAVIGTGLAPLAHPGWVG